MLDDLYWDNLTELEKSVMYSNFAFDCMTTEIAEKKPYKAYITLKK